MKDLFTEDQEDQMENANAFFDMCEFAYAQAAYNKIDLRKPNAEGEVIEPPCGFAIGRAIIDMRLGKCKLKLLEFEAAIGYYHEARLGLEIKSMPMRIVNRYAALIKRLRQIIHYNNAYCFNELCKNNKETADEYRPQAIDEIEKAIELGKENSFCVHYPAKDYYLASTIYTAEGSEIAARDMRLKAEGIERRLITVGMAYGSF